MPSPFADNWRQQQNLASTPLQDAIYRQHLCARIIERPQDEEDARFELDRCLGIDATITVAGGMRLLVQEKSLSYKHARHNTITLEKWQNPRTKEEGDWFTIAADCYFCGYLNESGDSYDRWCLLNWASVKLAHRYARHRPIWKELDNDNDGCRASFVTIEANALYRICPDAFLAQSNMLSIDNSEELEALNCRRQYGYEVEVEVDDVSRCCA